LPVAYIPHKDFSDASGISRESTSSVREAIVRDHSEDNQLHLQFKSLFDPGRRLAFPCDAKGQVDLDRLGRRALNDYLFARVSVGRVFSRPEVVDGREMTRLGCMASAA
jgi:hypothetical protein